MPGADGDADGELIAAAKRGDSASLARLIQAHYLAVKKYLITITLDRNLAEDLTQETMIRAIQRIGQYSGRAKFSTWLMAIATNLYMDNLRRRQRERRLQAEAETEALLLPSPNGPDPEWQEVLHRLAGLPREVALPLVLHHYHGYTYEEIGRWMKIPAGTVKSRIFHGVQLLRKGLAADEQ